MVKSLKTADIEFYIHVLLKIAATHPVMSYECERSISKLRLVKLVMRTMKEEWLNGLAPMYAHPDINLNIDSLIETFARLYPRRMKLVDITSD